jgi:NAD(P)-dependent dehydrogenase (short-subunit alcohol dehydrogenase family)
VSNTQAHIADLSSHDQTKQVDRIAAEEPPIDVLINNAGNIFTSRAMTADVLERTFALNTLFRANPPVCATTSSRRHRCKLAKVCAR